MILRCWRNCWRSWIRIWSQCHQSVKLREIMEQKEKAQADLDEKMDRWVYLNDLAERIEAQKSEK